MEYDCSGFSSVRACYMYNRMFGYKPLTGVAVGHAVEYLVATALLAYVTLRVRGKLSSWTVTHLVTLTGAMEVIGYAMRAWLAEEASLIPAIVSQFFLLVAPST
jgi:hypothetical protein